jgi:hypothetical protein
MRRGWHCVRSDTVEAGPGADRWGYLLFLLFLTIVLMIAIPNSPWALVANVALVSWALLIALRTARVKQRTMRIAYGSIGVALALSVALAAASAYVTRARATGGIFVILVLLLLVTIAAILGRIVAYERVTGQSLLAALSAYLMIGLFFAFLYLAVNAFSIQPFFAQGPNSNPAVYVYMSYITMTTTGYGDYTPGTDLGRAFVALETLVGQIFLVTTVARLVSMYSGPVAGSKIAKRGERLDEQAPATADEETI